MAVKGFEDNKTELRSIGGVMLVQTTDSSEEKHGDCNVSRSDPDNPHLANWVHNQRRQKKNGMLNTDKIHKLEKVHKSF